MLTTTELEKLSNLIEKNHLFFTASQVGKHVLTDSDKKKLLSFGIDISKLPNTPTNIHKAYLFGQLAGSLEKHVIKDMTFRDFERFINSKNWIPLTKIENSALRYIENYAYNAIKGLGQKQSTKLGNIFIENDKKLEEARKKIIKDQAKQALIEHKSKKQLASDLREATEDWSRDWDRVSDHIMHGAFSQGQADMVLDRDGPNAKAFMDVYPWACKHCINLYLTNGIGSRPKVFTIEGLRENGTNVGRKVADFLPVIPPAHPWCRCTINRFQTGSEWDEEKGSFKKPKVVSKKPGLVTLTVNGKTYTA